MRIVRLFAVAALALAPLAMTAQKAPEPSGLGHRTNRWHVEYSADGRHWQTIKATADGRTIGHKWIVRFPAVTARYLRLCIDGGRACPALHTFGVYKQSPLFQ